MNIYDYKTINAAVHLLFLVESLLLKEAAPIIEPELKQQKLHLLVEELRPRGTKEALEAVSLLKDENSAAFERALRDITEKAAGRMLTSSQVKRIISKKDVEHLSFLIKIIADSGTYINWGGQKEII